MSVEIRAATIADAPALGAVQMAALLAGYSEFLQSTAALPGVADRVAWWRTELELPDTRAWLAELDGNATGLASTGPQGLVWLCVMPEHWGEGIGMALLAVAEAALSAGAQAEVPEGNARMRRLLERRGWVAGEPLGQREGRVAPELRYALGAGA